MASIPFVYNRTPGKLEEFIMKLQSVGAPEKMTTDYPKQLGFGSSHARGFPSVLRYAGLIDAAGVPLDPYKKGLRGGKAGRALVGAAIKQAYKPMFDVYPGANSHADSDLVTFVKSNSDLDDETAGLVVKTFKVLCKFADFDGVSGEAEEDGAGSGGGTGGGTHHRPRQRRDAGPGGVTINVNIALSVDATSDPAVYDAFFAAMAKHITGLSDGNA
ncbi:MAG: DUF5343 domain-containing protein [Actinomycetales bacterium]|nr:DUF5343 domain-containing protein [Actinomycetales bacterium]